MSGTGGPPALPTFSALPARATATTLPSAGTTGAPLRFFADPSRATHKQQHPPSQYTRRLPNASLSAGIALATFHELPCGTPPTTSTYLERLRRLPREIPSVNVLLAQLQNGGAAAHSRRHSLQQRPDEQTVHVMCSECSGRKHYPHALLAFAVRHRELTGGGSGRLFYNPYVGSGSYRWTGNELGRALYPASQNFCDYGLATISHLARAPLPVPGNLLNPCPNVLTHKRARTPLRMHPLHLPSTPPPSDLLSQCPTCWSSCCSAGPSPHTAAAPATPPPGPTAAARIQPPLPQHHPHPHPHPRPPPP